jgi:hypothetical protein
MFVSKARSLGEAWEKPGRSLGEEHMRRPLEKPRGSLGE